MRKRRRTKTDYTKKIDEIDNIKDYRKEWIGYILNIKEILNNNYYLGKVIYKREDKIIEEFKDLKNIKIKLDNFINKKKENIVFCCEEKKYRFEKNSKRYKNCIEKLYYIKYPKGVIIRCANRKITNLSIQRKEIEVKETIEKEEIKEIKETNLNIIKVNKDYKYKNRAEGLNYKIYLWIFIEEEILIKKDLNLLNKEIRVLYRFSLKLMIDELRKYEYTNYYTHIPIVSDLLKKIEEEYIKNNEIKLNSYIENRLKKIVLDTVRIKKFEDDGLSLLGILFSIQLDFISLRYLFKEDQIKKILNFHINLLPLESKKYLNNNNNNDSIEEINIEKLNSNKLLKNKFNPFLERFLGPIINIEKKYIISEEERDKEELNNLTENILS